MTLNLPRLGLTAACAALLLAAGACEKFKRTGGEPAPAAGAADTTAAEKAIAEAKADAAPADPAAVEPAAAPESPSPAEPK